MASVRLAQIAREVGVKRFLYASSCSMYGAAGQGLIAEETPLRPLTPYAVSKARTEEDLAKLADSDFSPVLMRNATAYGVSPRLRADLVLNNLVCWAYTTGEVRLTSDGTAWRPVVHVEDIAHAFEVAVAAPRRVVHNQAFNVGVAGENYQVRELAHIVEDTVPGAKVVYATGGGPDQRSYRVDFSKLSTSFPDFKPRWNARLGAKELYSLFQKVGLKVEDFQGPRYVRLEQLKRLLETGRLQPNLRWKL